MRGMSRALLLAGVLVLGLPAAADAATRDFDWGTITSSRAHSGRAVARVWVTSFSAKPFQVYGRLYDRDRHSGHCAYIRARFHYFEGGASWSPSRRFCASGGGRTSYRFAANGEVRRVEIKLCVAGGRRGPVTHCRTETIRDEDLAQ